MKGQYRPPNPTSDKNEGPHLTRTKALLRASHAFGKTFDDFPADMVNGLLGRRG